MTTATPDVYTIDATGKRLGRVASEAAHALMGKHRTDAVKHVLAPVRVEIAHAKRLVLDERKLKQKEYEFYSGYPDGRRVLTLTALLDQKGIAEVVRRAVYGMLPSNKLRAPRMKKLVIHA